MVSLKPEIRIGFYVCHCGHNIASMVDCPEVAAYVGQLPGVVLARDYKYMCSDPGQELIQKDIAEFGLNRIVVASCSPLLHEHTFRAAVAAGGVLGAEARYGMSVRIEADPTLVSPDFSLEKFKTATRVVPEQSAVVSGHAGLMGAPVEEEDEDLPFEEELDEDVAEVEGDEAEQEQARADYDHARREYSRILAECER